MCDLIEVCVFACVSEAVLLRGIFKVGKRSHDVLLTQTRVSWSPIIPETQTGQSLSGAAAAALTSCVTGVVMKKL